MAKKVVIIGAGASGLMAALAASQEGAAVTILEQNDKPGRKLLATGNGRCNYTNKDQALLHYHSKDMSRVKSVLASWPMEETLRFFEELGICPKERNGWYYPNSDQAQAVLDVLLMELAARKVKIKTREHVTEIRREKGKGFTVLTDGWHYEADSVILCAGSGASSVTGSTCQGLEMLSAKKIQTLPFLPALCPLHVSGIKTSLWAGVRIQGTVTLYDEKGQKKLGSESGELQLTEKGISGIPVFQLSYLAVQAISRQERVFAELDFLPGFSADELQKELSLRKERSPYKTLTQCFVGLLPEKLIKALLTDKMDCETAVSKVKSCRVKIEGQKDIRQGQICQGGVSFAELKENLELKKVPGLFVAGELVDVNGDCGGYNLQWAWSSGHLAGTSAAQ